MQKIRSKDTVPEQQVARLLRALRYTVLTQETNLPGKPDFVLPRHKLAIFVHGCFWHRHRCRRGQSKPSTHAKFWERKFATNVRRDRKVRVALRKLNYKVLVIWECQLRKPDVIKKRIRAVSQKNARPE